MAPVEQDARHLTQALELVGAEHALRRWRVRRCGRRVEQ
jgi:hypothetical protein